MPEPGTITAEEKADLFDMDKISARPAVEPDVEAELAYRKRLIQAEEIIAVSATEYHQGILKWVDAQLEEMLDDTKFSAEARIGGMKAFKRLGNRLRSDIEKARVIVDDADN